MATPFAQTFVAAEKGHEYLVLLLYPKNIQEIIGVFRLVRQLIVLSTLRYQQRQIQQRAIELGQDLRRTLISSTHQQLGQPVGVNKALLIIVQKKTP